MPSFFTEKAPDRDYESACVNAAAHRHWTGKRVRFYKRKV